ncbi:hypothetical protein [Bremerella sp. P1]|nr:hypothetical protein [Bremerella sp. P1]WDI40224.1 hypothetical protein PSR63_17225 [Bremerella sp. P1]
MSDDQKSNSGITNNSQASASSAKNAQMADKAIQAIKQEGANDVRSEK